MTPTHKEQLLADILAALLRIEAKLDTAKVADSEVDYWVRELSQPKRHGQPVRPGVVTARPEPQPTIPIVPTCWPVRDPGMPDPPIAPVRPQTVWKAPDPTDPTLPPYTITYGSAQTTGGASAEFRLYNGKVASPTTCADKATAPSLNQGRYMHGGWIHADGFSMVGP